MKRHPKQHLFPIISLLLVLFGILLLGGAGIDYSFGTIMAAGLIYFAANVAYGLVKKELTLKKILELAAIVLLVQFIALSYLL